MSVPGKRKSVLDTVFCQAREEVGLYYVTEGKPFFLIKKVFSWLREPHIQKPQRGFPKRELKEIRGGTEGKKEKERGKKGNVFTGPRDNSSTRERSGGRRGGEHRRPGRHRHAHRPALRRRCQRGSDGRHLNHHRLVLNPPSLSLIPQARFLCFSQ